MAMNFTYDPEDLSTDLAKVRLRIGDTNASQPQLSDEEINSYLASEGSVDGATRAALRALIGKYSRYTDKWVGDLKILASQRVRQYEALLEEVSTAVGTAIYGVPTAGGIYVAEKEAQASNPALVQGAIRVGIHDYQGD